MRHIDLFSGIGGFSLAADTVWKGEKIEHILSDNNEFCQKILKKHWPEAKIYGDIRTLTYANHYGSYGTENTKSNQKRTGSNPKRTDELRKSQRGNTVRPKIDFLTGGFPCQPFSQAGRRKGTADDRFLWPEMLRVIREFRPRWIIGENVAGLLTISEGLVFQQICADLEKEGYEVQPFVIPAVAVNAPHRRDRVWIVGYAGNQGLQRDKQSGAYRKRAKEGKASAHGSTSECNNDAPNPANGRCGQHLSIREKKKNISNGCKRNEWNQNWLEVATRLCGMDDGLPARLDGFELTKSAHRRERLKSLGNAIVPQVAIEIMKAIKAIDEAKR